ncbi:hypothetical protein CPB97_008651, partial [Podila verticillata]
SEERTRWLLLCRRQRLHWQLCVCARRFVHVQERRRYHYHNPRDSSHRCWMHSG